MGGILFAIDMGYCTLSDFKATLGHLFGAANWFGMRRPMEREMAIRVYERGNWG